MLWSWVAWIGECNQSHNWFQPETACSVPSDLDHEGQMSTAFQAEDTLWAKAQGGMDFGEAGSTPIVMVLALFHGCSIWLDEAINLPLCLSPSFCFMLCWGSVCGRDSFPAGSSCSENVLLDKLEIRLQPSLIASRGSSWGIRHPSLWGCRWDWEGSLLLFYIFPFDTVIICIFFLCKHYFYNKNVLKSGINNSQFSENLKWLHRIHDYSMITYSKSPPNMAATNFSYSWMSMCIKRCTKGEDLKSCLHKTKKVITVLSDGC